MRASRAYAIPDHAHAPVHCVSSISFVIRFLQPAFRLQYLT
jgi:hypothetical protein